MIQEFGRPDMCLVPCDPRFLLRWLWAVHSRTLAFGKNITSDQPYEPLWAMDAAPLFKRAGPLLTLSTTPIQNIISPYLRCLHLKPPATTASRPTEKQGRSL